jgi:hypothetical protein
MNRMRERLENAIRRGLVLSAALGGCSAEQGADSGSGGTSATTGGHAGQGGSVLPGDAGRGGDAGTADHDSGGAGGGGETHQTLPEYPKQSYPLCSGENYGGETNGYEGQCCVTAQCFTPPSGQCPAADEVGLPELANFPPGSGSCGCVPESGKDVDGPFAPRSDDEATTPGRCCYLVAAIGCTGRPLLVGGAPRVATATRRSDWTSRPSWA